MCNHGDVVFPDKKEACVSLLMGKLLVSIISGIFNAYPPEPMFGSRRPACNPTRVAAQGSIVCCLARNFILWTVCAYGEPQRMGFPKESSYEKT